MRISKPYRFIGILCIASLIPMLFACTNNSSYAPVVNAWQQPEAKSGTYLVRKGDTVYSIAWAFGLDYRALATANHLKSPYEIKSGERLRMTTAPRRQATKQVAPPISQQTEQTAPSRHPHLLENEKVIKVYVDGKKAWVRKKIAKRTHEAWVNKPVPTRWDWPARGRIAKGFSNTLAGNKGINIAGRFGEPVKAAASGQVVYSGDGVRGYGNLLIIKHNDSYLSAYAYNKKLLVKVGDRVRAGQTIAEMGRDNAGTVMLHFEIRRNGKPVNPMRYLRA